MIHTCEGHLKRLLLNRLAADREDPYGDFGRRTSGALSDPAKWAAFVAEANAAGLAHTSAWLAGKAAPMRRQFVHREQERPYSNGAVEGVFDEITRRLWTRRFVFRNRQRLELALRLMLLDKEGVSDELRYREAIRSALLRGSGLPPTGRRTRRPGRILHPRRGQGGNRADGCEACAERPTREGVLRTEEGGSRQPDPSEVPAPAAGDALTVKHGAGRAAAAV